MHPAMIQAALKMRGVTQSQIAVECGRISNTSVYQVIHGRSRSKRIEHRIAGVTGLPLADLWPQWYGPDAKRRRRTMSTVRVAEAIRINNTAGEAA